MLFLFFFSIVIVAAAVTIIQFKLGGGQAMARITTHLRDSGFRLHSCKKLPFSSLDEAMGRVQEYELSYSDLRNTIYQSIASIDRRDGVILRDVKVLYRKNASRPAPAPQVIEASPTLLAEVFTPPPPPSKPAPVFSASLPTPPVQTKPPSLSPLAQMGAPQPAPTAPSATAPPTPATVPSPSSLSAPPPPIIVSHPLSTPPALAKMPPLTRIPTAASRSPAAGAHYTRSSEYQE